MHDKPHTGTTSARISFWIGERSIPALCCVCPVICSERRASRQQISSVDKSSHAFTMSAGDKSPMHSAARVGRDSLMITDSMRFIGALEVLIRWPSDGWVTADWCSFAQVPSLTRRRVSCLLRWRSRSFAPLSMTTFVVGRRCWARRASLGGYSPVDLIGFIGTAEVVPFHKTMLVCCSFAECNRSSPQNWPLRRKAGTSRSWCSGVLARP